GDPQLDVHGLLDERSERELRARPAARRGEAVRRRDEADLREREEEAPAAGGVIEARPYGTEQEQARSGSQSDSGQVEEAPRAEEGRGEGGSRSGAGVQEEIGQ